MRASYKRGITTLTLTAVAVLIAIAAQSVTLADEYRVAFSTARSDDDGSLRLATVDAKITPRNGEIGFYRAGSDTGLFHQWATFLLEIEARDQNGELLELIYRPHSIWQVAGPADQEIDLHYKVLLQHDRFPNQPGDDELASAHEYGVFWTARALFLEGANSRQISVHFDVPDDWHVSTPWLRVGTKQSFLAKDNDDLLNAAFLAGTHQETVVPIGDGEARVALGPPVAEAIHLFRPLLEAYLNRYSELFGQSPDDAILLTAVEASFFGGGVMGRTISLSIPEEADLNAALPVAAYIIAHEGFHLWNVQWARNGAGSRDLEWLNEGAAEYYALLTSLRLGNIDVQFFLTQLSDHYSKYLNALQSGQTLVSAADSKLTSVSSYDLIYSGGMLTMLLLDLNIRADSNGSISLDDLMKHIHKTYSNTDEPAMDLVALESLLEKEFSIKFGDVFKNNLLGSMPLPLSSALSRVGLEVSIVDNNGQVNVTIGAEAIPTEKQFQSWSNWIGTEL